MSSQTVYIYLQPHVSLVSSFDRTLRTSMEFIQSFPSYDNFLIHLPRLLKAYKLPLDDRAKLFLDSLPSTTVPRPPPPPAKSYRKTYRYIPQHQRKVGSQPERSKAMAGSKNPNLKREGPWTPREKAKMAASCQKYALENWSIRITDGVRETQIFGSKALYSSRDEIPIPEGWRRGRSPSYKDKFATWHDDLLASQHEGRLRSYDTKSKYSRRTNKTKA